MTTFRAAHRDRRRLSNRVAVHAVPGVDAPSHNTRGIAGELRLNIEHAAQLVEEVVAKSLDMDAEVSVSLASYHALHYFETNYRFSPVV